MPPPPSSPSAAVCSNSSSSEGRSAFLRCLLAVEKVQHEGLEAGLACRVQQLPVPPAQDQHNARLHLRPAQRVRRAVEPSCLGCVPLAEEQRLGDQL
eukprot:scaffold50318_cov45-Phaeocystis_antarctica.AAC.2